MVEEWPNVFSKNLPVDGVPGPRQPSQGESTALAKQHVREIKKKLGNSGIKFEVEGGEGSAGADTYIPLQKSFILASFFTENCDFAAFF